MSYLDRLMEARTPDLPSEWKHLTDADHIEELIRRSYQQPVAVFKHSTRCGTSSLALWQLAQYREGDVEIWYLDILRHRALSNQLATRLDVIHQSPQLLLIRDGQLHFHTSHHRIHAETLREALHNRPA